MDWGAFNIIFNFLVLIFWLRIWMSGDSRLFFNPYIAPISRLTESMFSFLWPVNRAIPTRVVAAFIVLGLIALRGIVLPQGQALDVVIGFESQMCPSSWAYRIAFSALSFGVFLFKVWGFSLIFVHASHGSFDHAGDALYRVSLPFSDIKVEARPLALAIFGMLLAFLMNLTGDLSSGVMSLREAPVAAMILRYFISAFACWATLLPVIATLIIIAVIGSWVAMFASSSRIGSISGEWLDLLMGPLRNHPIRIGMLDLTPLILIFVIQGIYQFLWRLLELSYHKLL